jgi:hypothetical protein
LAASLAAQLPELHFEPIEHRYKLEGVEVPGVTRVLDDQLDEFERVPWETIERRRAEGQLVHEAFALLVRGRLDRSSLDPWLEECMLGADRFLRESGVRVVASELRVAHRLVGYAGTLDLLGMLQPPAVDLFDVKSGVTVPRSVGPQTAAYKEACEARGIKIRRRYCLLLNPALANGYKLEPLRCATDWHIYLSALNVWRFKNDKRRNR